MSEWKEIDAEAKSGKEFLLLVEHQNKKIAIRGFYCKKYCWEVEYYHHHSDDFSNFDEMEGTGQFFYPEGWYEICKTGGDGEISYALENPPTHYMILPEPV